MIVSLYYCEVLLCFFQDIWNSSCILNHMFRKQARKLILGQYYFSLIANNQKNDLWGPQ